ncbi:LysE family translocator [Vibrio superstes]|uniref:Lysine transporter LysE n=1 Tax=Vibrio superstes NBRC 103154 TaxID=1219062 RepID=A0A511QRV6_9VIBR|nr:LysE family translocator [Vibrio superstes]GEM80078.1 lysine transporter LysE [Vibrio superstes NBRC 103154]
MSSISTYYIISALTVASPGAAVIFTITNTLSKGYRSAIRGYLGVAIGILIVGFIAHELLVRVGEKLPGGVATVTVFGGCYFLWLALSNLRRQPVKETRVKKSETELLSGVLISLTNPKALLFFTSVFPVYMKGSVEYPLLIGIFAINVLLIHSAYTYFTSRAQKKLSLGNHHWEKITVLLYLFLSGSCFMYAFETLRSTG